MYTIDKLVEETKRWFRNRRTRPQEYYDYNSATTYFMLRCMKNSEVEHVMSVGGALNFLVPMTVLYPGIVHISQMPVEDLLDFNRQFHEAIEFRQTDFFSLKDGEYPQIDTVISHVTLHCMLDTRYHNDYNKLAESGGFERPYQFAERLLGICPNVRNVIVSAAINENEEFKDNGSFLADRKVKESFAHSGFVLRDTLYDLKARAGWGMEAPRFSSRFPAEAARKQPYLVGSYFFQMA